MCLETQFDCVIVDRPMVLQSLYQLHNSLSDRKIITWEFFLNRFDTLFIEAQIQLERTGDVPHYRGLCFLKYAFILHNWRKVILTYFLNKCLTKKKKKKNGIV